MNDIADDPIYAEWKPDAGSALYTKLEALRVRQAERDGLVDILKDLRAQREDMATASRAVRWDSRIEDAAAAINSASALDAMIKSAERELALAEDVLRLAQKEVDMVTANLAAAAKMVARYEQLQVGVPMLFTDVDELKLAASRVAFANLSTVYLTAN